MGSPNNLALPKYCQPELFAVVLPHAVEAIERAHEELTLRAKEDANGCFGYFPALEGAEGISNDLPACIAFEATLPKIAYGGMVSLFNFLRLSNRQQYTEPVYHLDTNAATALSGDIATLNSRLVRRMLLNLSPNYSRTLSYLDIDPLSVELESTGSYVKLKNPEEYQDRNVTTVIPPREGSKVHAVGFYSNKVLHSGRDDEFGHFVAGYGYEVDLNSGP
jgi:hypothetical protein